MGELFKKYRTILLVLFLLMIGWWSYASFFKGTGTTPDLVAESGKTGEVGKDLLNLLLESNKIKLDSEIFESQILLRLQDFGKPILPETVGRTNPFAPLDRSESPTSKEAGPTISVSIGR